MAGNKATAIFDGDDSRLLAAARRIDKTLLGLEAKFAKMATFGAKLAAPLIAAGAALGYGIERALDVGGHFHDLSAQTGIAVKDLVALEQEFKAAGKSGEDVPKVIGKMQKALAEGTANDTLGQLGVDLEKIRAMTPADQFHEIGAALAAVKDPADRTAAAMAIFGKEGASLLSMFADKGFGDAAKSVGDQAEILNRDAALFDDVSDKLALVGTKVQGFFVGVADKVAPVLEPLLDGFANLDLSGLGQQIGDLIAFTIQAFTDGRVGELMLDALELSFGEAANFLAGALLSIPALLGDALLKAAVAFVSFLLEKTADALGSLAVLPGFGKATQGADALRTAAGGLDAYSARELDFGKTLSDAMSAGKIIDTEAISAELADLVGNVVDSASAQQAKALAALPQIQPNGATDLDLGGGAAASGVSALQRIGGAFGMAGGSAAQFAEAQLSEAQRTNSLLEAAIGILSDRNAPPRAQRTGAYG